MANSDELLTAIQNIAISYDRTPKDDQYEDGANFHFQLLDVLERIHTQMVIQNAFYQKVNNVTTNLD